MSRKSANEHSANHPHKERRKERRRRRRRKVHTALLAGAAFFAPHAAKSVTKMKLPTTASAQSRQADAPMAMITTSTDFRLPPVAFEPLIQEAAQRFTIDPDLVRAVIQAESAFNPLAVSTAGAQGLMQLMPALSEELGVTDPFDPRQNIMAGVRYLSALLSNHDGNIPLALASYNAGPGMVARYNGIPPFRETQQYIRTITNILHAP